MSGIFNAIGSLFGGGGGGGGTTYINNPAPTLNLPAVQSPTPAPPVPTASSANVQRDAFANTPRGALGSQATILTGGLGDTSTARTARKTLLGG